MLFSTFHFEIESLKTAKREMIASNEAEQLNLITHDQRTFCILYGSLIQVRMQNRVKNSLSTYI